MKLVALLFALCFTNAAAFRICSFNIQSFGEAKCSKPEVMNVIVKVISRCDIMLLMEIKDSTDKVMNILMAKLNSQPEKKDEFNVIISQRLGRKTYKEQYAFIYRKQLVAVKAVYQYMDHQDGDVDAFSREPFVVRFQTYKNDFVIIPQHTTPEAAVREIDELYDVYQDVKQKWKTENFIFMGDFNAGCGYVPKKYWKNIRLRTNQEFVWLIGDNVDTTVRSSTKCAYDRIVVHGKRLLNAVVPGSATVFDFMKEYGLTEAQALEISDHYPVEFQLNQMRKMKLSSSSR
ncbi:deoxyribonuclease gamma [Hyla sarda]|uniref:deoxyribonuclease gamma n=1 Tax=Hyla sarda TaxID=327740 RepID=UPI0024C45435|nr:deoxyribonuclease gamma [Hyla sarda]